MSKPVLRDSELLYGYHRGIRYERENKTESYVTVPPALIVTDSNGATWTLGVDYVNRGHVYFWGVYRNDRHTGEYAERLEYRRGELRALTPDGSKKWHERRPGHMALVPGFWL